MARSLSLGWSSGLRPSLSRTRLIVATVLPLITLAVLLGCSGEDARRQAGRATVRVDGIPLGGGTTGVGKTPVHPRITCHRESDTGAASFIEQKVVNDGDWRLRAVGRAASLELRMRLEEGATASVEFSIGAAVYASDTPTILRPGWSDGRAVFRDIPLVGGQPFRGKAALRRLVVVWECGGDVRYPLGSRP